MEEITIKINGMACGMCEAHINDVIRQNFKVKKVSSSHTKGETVVIAGEPLDENKLKEVIKETGYEYISMTSKPYEKKGLFHF